tara:strand:- start:960 stop:1394 length:435 start_codon:yes stop_codon:yes gene_type:complete
MIKIGDIVTLRPRYFRQFAAPARNHLRNKLFMVRRVVSEGLVNPGSSTQVYNKIIDIECLHVGSFGQREQVATGWVAFVRRPKNTDAVEYLRDRGQLAGQIAGKKGRTAKKKDSRESFKEAEVRYANLSIDDKLNLARELVRRI